MATKKTQRRTIARKLKHTGLPLPIRGKLAKMIVREDYLFVEPLLAASGCVVVRTYGCECCDPNSDTIWSYKEHEFHTYYGRIDLRDNPPKPPTPKGVYPPKPIAPALLALYKEESKRKDLEVLRKERTAAVVRASILEGNIRKLSTSMVRAHLEEKSPLWVEHGDWDCGTSPTGQCAYDHSMDPIHNRCLFCGKPEDRK